MAESLRCRRCQGQLVFEKPSYLKCLSCGAVSLPSTAEQPSGYVEAFRIRRLEAGEALPPDDEKDPWLRGET